MTLLFTSWSKDDEISDEISPTINYNISYDIWASTSITENGNVFDGGLAFFLWDNGDFGHEAYSDVDGNITMVNFSGGPGVGSYTIQSGDTEIRFQDGADMDDTWKVDNMTSSNDMILRRTDSGDDIVIYLTRTNSDPSSSWK